MQSTGPRRGRRRAMAPVAALAALAMAAAGCGGQSGSTSGSSDGDVAFPEEVTVVVPFGTGGGTDTWARFMSPYIEEQIGGTSLVLENVPGGEGIAGTNEFVRESQDDGTSVVMATASTYFQNLLGRPEAEYDFTELKPLIINGTGGVIYASKESGITSVADLQETSEKLRFGGSSATGLDTTLLLLFEVFGLDVESTFGFESRGDIRLAVQRGELNLDFQTTPAYLTQIVPLVESGDAVPLMSFGILDDAGELVRDPNVPDLPTPKEVFEDLNDGEAPSGPAWDAYRSFHAAGYAYQKGLWATPETPESVLEPYYAAAKELQEDPEFQAAAEEVLGGYPLFAGDEVEPVLRDAFDLGDEEREYVIDLLAEKYDTDLR